MGSKQQNPLDFLEIPDEEELTLQKLLKQASSDLAELEKFALGGDGQSGEESPFKMIKPEPGFCVKLKSESGEKLFINVCYCDDLPPPPKITEDELRAILQSEDPTAYRVPMSIGEPHNESDKSGQQCTAYDIIINKDFYQSLLQSELFKTFLISVAIDGLEDKYNISILKESWIVLKNKRYFGNMPTHYIQNRHSPLITELDSDQQKSSFEPSPVPPQQPSPSPSKIAADTMINKKDNEIKSKVEENVVPPPPKYRILKDPEDGYPLYLIAEFYMPEMRSTKDIILDLGEDRIILEGRPKKYFLDIFLPYAVVQEQSGAYFDRKTKVLMLTMPVLRRSKS